MGVPAPEVPNAPVFEWGIPGDGWWSWTVAGEPDAPQFIVYLSWDERLRQWDIECTAWSAGPALMEMALETMREVMTAIESAGQQHSWREEL